jgi:predicted small secreted protein
MRKSIIRVAGLVGGLVAGLLVSACNTIEGAGKDVSSAGKAVTETARDVKD